MRKNSIKNIVLTGLLLCIYVLCLQVHPVKAASDTKAPVLKPTYKVLNQKAIVYLNGSDSGSGLAYAKYIKGTLANSSSAKWNTKAKEITGTKSFKVTSSGNYSILLSDKAGNKTVKKINVKLEMRAVWISYLEFLSNKADSMTYSQFKSYINTMFTKCKNDGMNTVIVQVRPCGDALYNSAYFPWSSYISGIQGKNPGYDPLSYMVTAAHNRGLRFFAWINPYRVSMSGVTNTKYLSLDNQARKWRNSLYSSIKRNVLTYNGQMYYNPSKTAVQTLIVNGVKEIVKKYNVEGIIFDDYFYPSLGSSYQSNFDATEYKEYKSYCEQHDASYVGIVTWRRNKVNTLLKKVHTAIKNIDSSVCFGISPQGNISNLESSTANYCDVNTWLKSTSYVDFISPQIYWSTTNKTSPYKKVLNQWISLRGNSNVNIYASIAAYKAGISKSEASAFSPADMQWATSRTNLQRQVTYGRSTGKVDGFMVYRYDNMVSSKASSEMKNLISILK